MMFTSAYKRLLHYRLSAYMTTRHCSTGTVYAFDLNDLTLNTPDACSWFPVPSSLDGAVNKAASF